MTGIIKAFYIGSGIAVAMVLWLAGAVGPALVGFSILIDASAPGVIFLLWFAAFVVWVAGYSAATVAGLELFGIDLPTMRPNFPPPPPFPEPPRAPADGRD